MDTQNRQIQILNSSLNELETTLTSDPPISDSTRELCITSQEVLLHAREVVIGRRDTAIGQEAEWVLKTQTACDEAKKRQEMNLKIQRHIVEVHTTRVRRAKRLAGVTYCDGSGIAYKGLTLPDYKLCESKQGCMSAGCMARPRGRKYKHPGPTVALTGPIYFEFE